MAYATAEFDGKTTEPALLKAIFLSGTDRHDHHATMADTNPGEEPAAATPYGNLLCGRGKCFFTGHAYGPQAKERSPDFVAALHHSSQIPFKLMDNHELDPGEVNIFCPPPHQLNNCRGRWGHVIRYDGLTMYIQLPETPVLGECELSIVCPGYGARQPRDSEYRGGITIWVTGKQG
jgi:hypothetical protein